MSNRLNIKESLIILVFAVLLFQDKGFAQKIFTSSVPDSLPKAKIDTLIIELDSTLTFHFIDNSLRRDTVGLFEKIAKPFKFRDNRINPTCTI